MTNILVTGANGQVGSELQFLARNHSDWQFQFTDHTQLDITDEQAVRTYFAKNKVDYCINCAAYTAVDKAESEPDRAEAINVQGVVHLAKACQQHDAQLLHISTDYVYDNAINRPLREDDPTDPKSVYARTKLAGDLEALQHNERSIVLRTSWVYSSFGHNFVKTMIRLGKERDQLGIVFDQIGTPTYARSLADAILHVISQLSIEKSTMQRGVFHYSNEGVCSWYDFASAIFELKKIDVNVLPILSKAYPTPAARPTFSVLDKSKIKEVFGVDIPHWRADLKACLEALLSPVES
ncbi:MAG: dTDP-4-dehydrorhamnose reductase [Bacteroidota bacterium]